MRKFSGVMIAASATAVVLTGLASGSGAAPGLSQRPAPSGTLTMAIETDPGSLDPQLTLLGAARTVNSFVYDPLLTVVGPGKVASGLASSWKVRSAKQVQLTLRRGVTCSDGTRMTASVVKRNIEFVGNPANGSPWYGSRCRRLQPSRRTTAPERSRSPRRSRARSCSRVSGSCRSCAHAVWPIARCSLAEGPAAGHTFWSSP